jgi:MFS family permease
MNFPIFISTMAVSVFHKGPGEFGLLTSVMAVGSVSGALVSARQATPRVGRLFAGALAFGLGLALAALMPSYALFGLALVIVGAAAQTFTTTAIGAVQLATEPAMRGRVLAILLAIALGGTPVGAPIIGRVADLLGPRWALGVGGAAGVAAAAVGLYYLIEYGQLRFGPAAEANPKGQ